MRHPAIPRVTVLGVGAMGRLHARVFAQASGEFVLAGVYDRTAETAREVAHAFSVAAFATEGAAIASADLVVIASPIDAHAGAARRALARGRHVFVEKPLCGSAGEAFALSRAVGRGQRLFVGHSERFNPVVRALHRMLAPGDVRTVRFRRTSTPGLSPRRGAEHPAVVSLGVHDLDLIAHLTDSPVALRDVEHLDHDRADLVLTAARGALAWVHVDRRARLRERTIEVTTGEAVYTGDLLTKTLTVRTLGEHVDRPCQVLDEEPLVAQASSLARALAGEATPLAGSVDGARAIALATEALRRAGEGDMRATGTS